MTPEEKQANQVGPGGYKCFCCGPAPKDRPKWRRVIRSRLKAIHRKYIQEDTDDTHL